MVKYECISQHIYYNIEQQASSKTKGEDQKYTYIYYNIEQQDYTKTKGKDQTDTYIY